MDVICEVPIRFEKADAASHRSRPIARTERVALPQPFMNSPAQGSLWFSSRDLYRSQMALLLRGREFGPRVPIADCGLPSCLSLPGGHEMLPYQGLKCNFYFSECFLMGHWPSINGRMLNWLTSSGPL
jgi:hypothetical protein